jgi:hypothetical protein
MTRSRGSGDETRSATDERLLCDIGDNDVAFSAFRTRGEVDRITDIYVFAV